MDDIHTFHTRSYDKADDLKEPNFMRRSLVLLQLIPGLLLKGLVIVLAELYYLLLAGFFSIVPKKLIDIRGKLAVVTGGSNGIGRAICLELARCGCNIACLDVDLKAAEELCTELSSLGVKSKGYKVDVTDNDELEKVKKQINADLGTVDILVNNAGLIPKNSFRDGETSNIRRVMDVNILSHFWTTRIFIDDIIARRGFVVAISSILAFYPASNTVTYTTSKYAVRGFMDALHMDSRHENWGINTLTVFPHLCNTRKGFVNFLKEKLTATSLERFGLLTPDDVGKETVRAMRSGERYTAVPRFYLFLLKFFQAMTLKAQDIADDLFVPHLDSHTNYTASISNTGCIKSQ